MFVWRQGVPPDVVISFRWRLHPSLSSPFLSRGSGLSTFADVLKRLALAPACQCWGLFWTLRGPSCVPSAQVGSLLGLGAYTCRVGVWLPIPAELVAGHSCLQQHWEPAFVCVTQAAGTYVEVTAWAPGEGGPRLLLGGHGWGAPTHGWQEARPSGPAAAKPRVWGWFLENLGQGTQG